jgi:hypothetical protein
MKVKNKNTEQEKTITIDMPEVKDIPGQEHVRPPRIGEMADITPSSDDEEGKGVVDDLNKDSIPEEAVIATSAQTDVSKEEIELLDKSERPPTEDSQAIEQLELDEDDGEDPLNEEANPLDMGEDLDVPGAELDDENEELGEEDEENNPYTTTD